MLTENRVPRLRIIWFSRRLKFTWNSFNLRKELESMLVKITLSMNTYVCKKVPPTPDKGSETSTGLYILLKAANQPTLVTITLSKTHMATNY